MEMITTSQCIWCIEFFRATSGSQDRIVFPRALILRQHCLCQHSQSGLHREGSVIVIRALPFIQPFHLNRRDTALRPVCLLTVPCSNCVISPSVQPMKMNQVSFSECESTVSCPCHLLYIFINQNGLTELFLGKLRFRLT